MCVAYPVRVIVNIYIHPNPLTFQVIIEDQAISILNYITNFHSETFQTTESLLNQFHRTA